MAEARVHQEPRRAAPGARPRGRTGRLAKVQGRPPRRYAVTYDVNGPHVRLGFLWFLLVVGALAVDIAAVAAVYAVTAALAGFQTAKAWHPCGRHPNELVSALIGAVIPIAAIAGPHAVGVAVLASAGVAMVAGWVGAEGRQNPLACIGFTLQSGLLVGLAAAAPVLSYRVEVGAAAALIIFVSVYEMGDYLVGSGSKNAVEGPLAGFTAIAVFTFALWVVTFPPFQENSLLAFGALAAGLCPVGQLLGSAILPRSDAKAPALRRLDSLLVLGPVWVVAIWSYTDII